MKKLLIILFAACNSLAFGQSRSVSKSIQDDGKSLSIHVSGTIDGQDIKYDHTFDLSFLDKLDKAALKEKLLSALDFSSLPAHESAMDEPDESEVAQNQHSEMSIAKTGTIDRKQPFSKEVKYNSEGEMYMHYRFVKNGEDFEYERTLNAKGKSEREKQRIIEETEQEIGFTIDK